MIWAKQGISIDSLSLLDHKFSKVYIKWNKKLHIKILSLLNTAKDSSTLSVPPLYRILKVLDHTTEEIEISHYITGEYDLAINYNKRDLYINSAQLKASASLKFLKSYILIPDLKLDIKKFKLKMDGEVRISEKHNQIEILSHAQVNETLEADFFIDMTKNRIELSANSKSIPNLNFINRFVSISNSVKPWIFDKLQADSYQLDKLSTHFSPSKPSEMLSNLKAKATLKNVTYNFDKALSPIVSEIATIEYKNRRISITPTNATYHGYKISNTEVLLSNLKYQPRLLLSFHTKEHVNPTFLKIIEHYLQKIPLKQFSGDNDIDFQLDMDLSSSKIHIQTDIQVKDAELLVNNHPLYIHDARVRLDDNELTIKHAKFKSFRKLQTSLSGKINLKSLLGDLKINIAKFSTPLTKLLNDVVMKLHFRSDGIHINTSNSHWQLFKNFNLMATKNSLFIDKNKTLYVDNLRFYKPGFIDANLKGRLVLDGKKTANTLLFDVKQIKAIMDNNETVVLEHPFKIKADTFNPNHFTASRSIDFSVAKKPVSLKALSFHIGRDIKLLIEDFRYKDSFQTDLDFHFNQESQLGAIELKHINADIKLTKPELLLLKNQKLHFEINATKNLTIKESDFNISYSDEKIHQLSFHNISKIASFSPFLQKHKVKKGRLNFITRDFNHFNLFATINYFPITGYINTNADDTIFVASTYGEEGFHTVINDAIRLKIDKAIHLDIEKTNLDLQPFLNGSQTTSDEKEPLPPIHIQAKDGYLQLTKKGKILYTKLLASIENSSIKASLFHDKGEALMVLRNSGLELYGEKFNDAFIQNLINFKGLKGGSYNFFMNGNADKLLGGIEINNATAKGFALYNNLLSFLNTIPAIVTFQSPGFNREGFKVNHGEIHFEKIKEMVHLKSIKLKGNASNILGSGSVNVEKSTIDLTLRIFLFKEMGTILSSVPIAGYLLLGDDGSLTTTLTIKGKLSDPKISINLGQDILMAPINILKRTLMAPVRLFDWLTGNKPKKDKNRF